MTDRTHYVGCWREHHECEAAEIERIKRRKYECFIEDHQPNPWTPGRCADYSGRGSMAVHLYRCKRKSGHGIGGLFCRQHALIRTPAATPPAVPDAETTPPRSATSSE